MSKFFINRPIVAIVISILTVIVGAITIVSLPISQFPAIAPPEVQVQTTFVGAHVGCYAENLGWVGQLLDRCPNFYVDISARIADTARSIGSEPIESRAATSARSVFICRRTASSVRMRLASSASRTAVNSDCINSGTTFRPATRLTMVKNGALTNRLPSHQLNRETL